MRRFLREARAAVSHDHVVTIYAIDEGTQPPIIVMEYVDGCSLQERIDNVGPLDLDVVLRIGMQVASGLSAAHRQGLVHRDIQPANILLENGVERVKLTDFGLARAVDDIAVTRTGQITGTPQYMSPEQAQGQRVDHRTDLSAIRRMVARGIDMGHADYDLRTPLHLAAAEGHEHVVQFFTTSKSSSHRATAGAAHR